MVYCVQLQLQFRNQARRDTVQSNLTARLDQLLVWGEPLIRSYEDVGLGVEVRCVNQADADDLWVNLSDYVGTGINGPVAGSEATRHSCRHDEDGSIRCQLADSRVW